MELLYFILGIFFISNLVPIVDGLSSWFLTWIELKKTNLSEKINLTTINMRQASTSADKELSCRVRGFCEPDSEDYDEEEWGIMKFKCYDTCSLLEEAGHLFEKDDFTLVISSIVLEELESIKTSLRKDADVKYSARKVLQDLDAHYGSYEIVLYNESYGEKMEKDGISLTNDAKIIACGRHFAESHPDDEIIFVSNDLICRHIASLYFPVEQV